LSTSDTRFDFRGYAVEFADRIGWLTGITVRKAAKSFVRVDTSALRNSIRLDRVSETENVVSANTEYAAAQEYGRPDLPNYGYTPYFRPAAKEGKDKLEENVKKAARLAERAAR